MPTSREEIHTSFVNRFASPSLKPTPIVSDEDLRRVENELGTTFPKSFTSFLTRHGPVFTPSVLKLVTGGESEQAPEGAGFDVQEFFEPNEIVETHRLYSSGGMEEWLIPIAMDCMGNVFGFKREQCIPPPDDCAVWFFDHDYFKIHQEAVGFDTWLASFLELAK
jgi:hypothetical protein